MGAIRQEQAGFRSREESMGQVCSLIEALLRRARVCKPTYAAFIDFRKAFDTVPHGALLHCIDRAGVRGRCFSFVRALYSQPAFRVRIGHLFSDSISMQQGVRQGDPLSSILFNLYINSILDDLEVVKVLQYQLLVVLKKGELVGSLSRRSLCLLLTPAESGSIITSHEAW